jgi:hypothetical protein
MASNAKRKTTMAKLNRESRMRERKQDKLARKQARKQAASSEDGAPNTIDGFVLGTPNQLVDEPADDAQPEPSSA